MNQPDLDQWTTAFGLMALLGIFLTPFLLKQAGPQRHQIRYVAAILVLFSLVLFYYVLYWSNYIQYFPFLSRPAVMLFFLFGGLFYLYLKELLHQPVSARLQLLHALPYIVGMGIHLILTLLRSIYPASDFQIAHWFYNVLPWLIMAHLSLYAIAILRILPLFKSLGEVAKWARWTSLCYVGFVLANWSYYALVQLSFFNRSWDYGISFSMVFFIGLVAYLAYVQPTIFQNSQPPPMDSGNQPTPIGELPFDDPRRLSLDIQESTEPEMRYRHSGLSSHLANRFARQLQEIMITEKLYHDNELRLDTVAERINISRHHLSQVLNEQLGMNFFEYVNSLRVEEARELLRQFPRQQLNIIEVAYQVGFNNKVSFNKAFKNVTGLTPSEFRRSVQESSGYGCPKSVDNV
ncbi:helix-turn-helix domain-containing protein [Spirosoma sp. BT702]|uniref:Helix-turn-helix domain-containing protein n=1 Tax=Spirosoma profusum TaxID=2771354 RepID=A0A926XW81_9BACT|nr:helix-turn-helix domain-containing protein [Spirosoma profusum]MBD2701914.1 helix-turn-helix domain-containing protein [Spirosoma profusum]